MEQDITSIRVSKTFRDWLVSHGKYGDTHEQILIRLIGDDIYKPTGDRTTKTYNPKDVDSKKYKKEKSNG